LDLCAAVVAKDGDLGVGNILGYGALPEKQTVRSEVRGQIAEVNPIAEGRSQIAEVVFPLASSLSSVFLSGTWTFMPLRVVPV
jgi:hypothetical protein